jgi:hypothetical protein
MTGSFTIQDPAMRAHLLAALAGYQDYHPELEEWTFRAPYSALVHRWDHLNDLADGVPDVDAKRAVNQLMLFLGPILAASVGSLAHTRKTNRVMFKDVWQIFPPGELAVASFFGVDAVARVLKYELNRDRWDIDLEYVDWNGERTGYSTTKVTVWRFDGFKFVTSLSVYPLAFSSSAAAIREQLVTRGRKFEQLRGYHFRNCVGSKILLETRCPEERPVSGRVIIDSFAYFSANNKVKTDLRSLSGDEEKDKPKTDARPGKNNSEMTAVKVSSSSYIRTEHLEDMTDEQCLMATPWLRGLDLKTKDWGMSGFPPCRLLLPRLTCLAL